MQFPFSKPLQVVELAGVLAGPAVGLFFAELGATVIKVENPRTGGDITRGWRLASEPPAPTLSAYYCAVNWRKQVVWADLEQTDDRDRVRQLIQTADIVISNFKQSAALRMGMDYPTLRELNPQLIFAHLSGYGATDDTPAFDVVLQAETGFMYMNGAAEGAPTKMPVALIDILAAHQLKAGILLALLHRATHGRGGEVRVSLQDAALASLANQATNYLMANHIPQRAGSLHPNIAPYGESFSTADGVAIVLAVGNEKQFGQLCGCLDAPLIANDPRFATNTLRLTHRAALQTALAQAFAQKKAATLLPILKTNGVPCGAINDMATVMATDAAQRLILEENGTKRMKTAVFEYKSS